MGLDSCPVMFPWLEELVPVLWLIELDLVSLKGSAVSSRRFWGVYGFSMSLGSPSGFGSVRHVYVHSCIDVALSATSPLLVPGIFASASVPQFFPTLQAKACLVGAYVDLSPAP